MNQDRTLGGEEPSLQVSELLRLYLRAKDEAQSQVFAEQLIRDHAEPVVRFVVSYKLNLGSARLNGSPDADDILGEVVVELVEVLRALRANTGSVPIRDFRGYVAAVAYRACSDYLRRKHPGRSRLKSKVRYILGRSRDFELWKHASGEWVCGLSECQGFDGMRAVGIQDVEAAARCDGISGLADLIRRIFSTVGGPVRFNDLVSVAADVSGIVDEADGDTDILELPDPRVSVETEVDRRLHLQRVWAEITRLPARQRAALLLNLTDSSGYGLATLLPVAGIASFAEIAAALEMSPEQLSEIWNNLPLDDAAVAAHLGVSRQQVVNLRKAARERLARRTRSVAKGAGTDSV
ncbi:MAG TPA: hypothetical protein VFV34_12830 [Blastocatellia bacterium]|nr:hypothetical protein [Blastocatellia bacterium]